MRNCEDIFLYEHTHMEGISHLHHYTFNKHLLICKILNKFKELAFCNI